MIVDPEPGLAGDIADDRAQAGVVDLAGPPAARADDVVVMGGLAADVGVLAVRQVETFDGADPLEEVEGAEDGGAPDGGAAACAAVTSSAAVKWPSCSAISAASARRGSVMR